MNKIRAILVGCGSISNAWLDAIKGFGDVEVVALADINIDTAEAVKLKYGLSAACFDDTRKALESAAADVVFDCTVPSAHSEITHLALKYNCNVLGEKPISDDIKTARGMAAAAEKSGLVYAVIQNRRYDANIITYRDALQSGEIGELTALNADFYIGAHFGGFRDEMDDVLLADMAIHTFDQARFISGCDPVAVYCRQWNPKGSWYKGCASAVAVFEMTGGVVFTYRGSWCAEGMNTSWESQWRAIGTKGSVLWDGGEGIKGESVCEDSGFIRKQKPLEIRRCEIEHKGHAGVIREFLDCLKIGKTPQTVCSDNIKSFAMVCAAIESGRTGRRVEV